MKLLLIDGSNLIFRAYYATEQSNIRNLEDIKVNAVYTLISMLDKIIKEQNPTHIYIAMDSGGQTFRHKMYEDYKGGRVQTPEALKAQFPIIKQYFTSLGIKYGQMDGYEADDIIATYADEAQKDGYFVKIISGDKDLLQLVDKNINVLTPKMGFAKECDYTPEVFYEKYEFMPNRFIEYKALVGDSSDNIVGIDKLGDKTAKKYIKGSNTIDDIINKAKKGEIKGKVAENLVENEDRIHKNLELVTLIKNVPLNIPLEQLKFDGYDDKAYCDFLKKQGFMKIYNKYVNENDLQKEKTNIEYEKITTFNINKHTDQITAVYTQNLEENYIISPNLGIAISSKKGNFYMELKDVNDEFIKFIKSNNKKVFYNVKQLLVNLKINEVDGIVIDVFLGVALLNPTNYKKNITDNLMSYNYFDIKTFEEVYGPKSNPKIPEDQSLLMSDIVSKSKGILEVYNKVLEKIQNQNLQNVLFDIEIPLSKVLAKVEQTGVYVDKTYLNNLKKEYESKVFEVQEELNNKTNININSSKQLATLLFDEWELPKKGLKKTTTSISTDITNLENLLQTLKDSNEDYTQQMDFINKVLEYRKLTKILNTYIKNIESFILDDSRVHPINHQLLAETGRLSVMDPNIQNIPIRSKEGQKIREVFKAQGNNKLIGLDYSQVELRVIASISQDEKMLEAFNKDLDIHEQTAKNIFNLEKVNADQRSKAKAINFGIIYGISPYGLAKQVGISSDEAKEFINIYFTKYPKIKEYMENQIAHAQKTEEVSTIFSRKRKIENINSKNFNEKEHAKRVAINTPIQGSAADIMKLALIEVDKELTKNNFKSKIIMQIHDEIIIEATEDEVDKVIKIVKNKMEEVVSLPAKLKVDYGVGKSWLDAK